MFTLSAHFFLEDGGLLTLHGHGGLRRLPPEGSIPGMYTVFEASGVGVVLIDRFIHERLYWNEFLIWLARRKSRSYFHISLSALIQIMHLYLLTRNEIEHR